MRPGIRLGVDVGSVRVGVAACDPAGVSQKTVSRVFNNEPNVNRETRERVLAAAQQLAHQLSALLGHELQGCNGVANRLATHDVGNQPAFLRRDACVTQY